MEIGENGLLGHHVHVRVVVLYKNLNVIVIIQSNWELFLFFKLVNLDFFRPENGGKYCSGQSTRIRSCENNPVNNIN